MKRFTTDQLMLAALLAVVVLALFIYRTVFLP